MGSVISCATFSHHSNVTCLACSSWASPTSIIFVILHVLYSVDILISFRVAFTESEVLVTNKADVARNYRRYSPDAPFFHYLQGRHCMGISLVCHVWVKICCCCMQDCSCQLGGVASCNLAHLCISVAIDQCNRLGQIPPPRLSMLE